MSAALDEAWSCPTCKGIGEVLGAVSPHAETDLMPCPDCDEQGRPRRALEVVPANDAHANDTAPVEAPRARRRDGYLDAPALDVVATSCCLCGRALLDAASLERGLGPTCAKKAGLGVAAVDADWDRARSLLAAVSHRLEGDDPRREANRLVHRIGAAPDGPEVARYVAVIGALGYVRLATALARRLVPCVVVRRDGDQLVVAAHKLDAESFERFRDAMRRTPGRVWVPETCENRVPAGGADALWCALRAALAARTLVVGRCVAAV